MKRRHTYLKSIVSLGVIFCAIVVCFMVKFGNASWADTTTTSTNTSGAYIRLADSNQDITFSDYVMSKNQITLMVDWDSGVIPSNASNISVTWLITKTSESGIAEVTPVTGSSDKMATVTATNAGEITITATISYYEGTNTIPSTKIVSCNIKIQFSIWANGTNYTNDLIPGETVLYMHTGDTENLQLTYGDPTTNCTWSSSIDAVASVNATSGKVTANGAGKTTVHVSYTPGNSTTPVTADLDIYVIPKTSPNNIDAYNSNSTVKVSTGGTFYLDVASTGVLNNNVDWVITRVVNGSREILDVSTGANNSKEQSSDLISLATTSDGAKTLKVTAKAGIYQIYIFPEGVYTANKDKDLTELLPYCGYVDLTVYANFDNINTTINVNDSYNVATAFNLTVEDFTKLMSSSLDENTSAEVFTYSPSTATGTAMQKGNATINVTGGGSTDSYTFAQINASGNTSFQINITIVNGLSIDRSSVTLAEGATLQLNAHSSDDYDGMKTWTSSNTSYVTVNANTGFITAISATPTNNPVVIEVTQENSDGTILRATCSVTVIKTITDIKLDASSYNLEVNKTVTVSASFTPNVSIAPLKWILSDESIVELSVASDNKSVVLKGLKAGSTVLTVVNSDNFITASCVITVLEPIQTVTLNYNELEVSLSKESIKLTATYTPSTATSTDLIWTTSNSSVATVDDEGFVTLKSAGTTIITVQPAYNPNLTMAQCVVTVIQNTSGLSLSKSEMTLEVGGSETLEYTLTPTNATATITWKTMNSKVATVNSSGKVTAVASGTTYIVATTENGYSASCMIIVTQKATGVTLDVYHLTLAVGKSYQVTATPNPVTSTETTFTWTSKDTTIATVNSSGKVTAVASGETIILVKTASGKVTYLYVTVYNDVKSMTLNYTKKTVVKGKTFTLKPVFTPTTATNKAVTYKSSSTSVATVSAKGVVKGVRGGSAVITVVSEDGGHVATCVVTVKEPVTSITLNKSSYSLGIGKSITLKATVKSTYSSTQTLKWTSSNTKVATVTSKGVVKGKKVGTVTIKVKATDGSGAYDTCTIHVVRQVTKITLNKTTIKMLTGATTKIKATVTPKNATYRSVKWSSSNSKIASVDSNGNITAVAVGNCKIYAKARDNGGKKAVAYVYVSKAVPSTGITVSSSDKDMVMVRGTSAAVSYTVTPNNTTDKVRFSSDNRSVASISSTGRVTARKTGVATITIRTTSGKTNTVNVTVVGLNRTSVTAGQYERVELWVEQISSGVKWYSENASVASVSDGSVVTRKKGTTRIVASVKGVRLYCKVTVK